MMDGVTVGETDEVGSEARKVVVRVHGKTVLSCNVHVALAPDELAELLREFVSVRAASLSAGRAAPAAPDTARPRLRVLP